MGAASKKDTFLGPPMVPPGLFLMIKGGINFTALEDSGQ